MKRLGLLALIVGAVALPASLHAAAPTRLDGVYDVSFTRAQYAAAGADNGELTAGSGNWGHFRLILRNSRYTQYKVPGPVPTGASGTYRVSGRLLVLKCTCDTRNWPYRWSFSGNKLVLRRGRGSNPDGSVGEPTGFVVKPWRKI